MRLLLDAHFSPAIADALSDRGHDVVALVADPTHRHDDDPQVFVLAQQQRRAVVTENVRDFRPLVDEIHRDGRQHHGLLFTSNRSRPRHDHDRFIGQLVTELDAVLRANPGDEPTSLEMWL